MSRVRTITEQRQWWGGATRGALARVEGVAAEEPGPAMVAHVVDSYHRYPGEIVTFFTRVTLREPLSDLTLRISIPEGLVLDNYRPPPEMDGKMPYVEVTDRAHYLVWSLACAGATGTGEGELTTGTCYEYQAEARVSATHRHAIFESRAVLTTRDQDNLAEESVPVMVWAKGRYLRHLPELYDQDELMARFLMLFESFWAPVETQIASIRNYLDPKMTPAGFLSWLASWVGLELDGHLPEERQRRLIQSAVWLHRRRGTKQGLRAYLEIYTGGKAQIIEHRANDLRLGPGARLGPAVALGTGNQPQTFTVILRLPPIPSTGDEEERARQELERRRTIEALIDAQKPAHTGYRLRIVPYHDAETQPTDRQVPAVEAEAQTDETER
jgi:phage tail-like protein